MRLAWALCILIVLLPGGVALAGWGADLDPDQGRRLVEDVQKDLLRIVKADETMHAGDVERFAKKSARGAIEAVKRYRNPQLLDLYVKLLDHKDWRVVHRALLVLEHYWDESTFPRAWSMLEHKQRRVREKAAITCLKLWDGSRSADAVQALLAKEEDLHVRGALRALVRRAEGTLPVVRLHREQVATLEDGLMLVPFYRRGVDEAPKLELRIESGRKSKKKPPPAGRWVGPLLGYGEEEVVGGPLEPFGSVTPDGSAYHVGEDAGSCLDGAGVYAPAAGIVRTVMSGGPAGTQIVLHHSLGKGILVTSLVLHAGDTAFVKPGERVEAGQLLGTVGMSWSGENGGKIAHVHLGLHRGAYDPPPDHDGYIPESEGLTGWLDPAEFLPSWMLRTRPLVEVRRSLPPAFEAVVREIDREGLGKAHQMVERVMADSADERVASEGTWLLGELEASPERAMRRARAWLDAGYPTRAFEEMDQWRVKLGGLPDVRTLEELLEQWRADASIGKAVEGEKKVEALEKKTSRSRKPEKHREDWEELRDRYGDTALSPRIDAHLGD
jgi:hypothetical protein